VPRLHLGACTRRLMSNIHTLSHNQCDTDYDQLRRCIPICRCAHSANVWQDRLFIFGGGDGSRRFKDLYVLDLGMACTATRKLLHRSDCESGSLLHRFNTDAVFRDDKDSLGKAKKTKSRHKRQQHCSDDRSNRSDEFSKPRMSKMFGPHTSLPR
jgi:hypothetical protein